jgi:hypothetical protein
MRHGYHEQRHETEAMPMTAGTTEEFKAIVIMANRVACGFNEGALDTFV